jgi:hypothetical protein
MDPTARPHPHFLFRRFQGCCRSTTDGKYGSDVHRDDGGGGHDGLAEFGSGSK